MPWLRFLSRLAFVCNLFFLLAVALRFRSFINDPNSVSTAVIIGYFMVFFLNPLVNLSYLGVLLVKRKLFVFVKPWLALANLFFLIIQILYILYFNDIFDPEK